MMWAVPKGALNGQRARAKHGRRGQAYHNKSDIRGVVFMNN